MEIKLAPCCYERDKERSWYNHNYYKLKNYGDWLCIAPSYHYCELYLYEECYEDENCYTVRLGYFSTDSHNNERFIEILSCTNTESCVQ